MKKIVIIFTFFLLFYSSLFAADPIFKSFNINGELMERWVTVTEKEYVYDDEGLLQTLYEYDEYRDTMYNVTSYLYDSHGNCIKETKGIYYTYSLLGRDNLDIYYQTWYEYDSQNRLIHKICDDSFAIWYEYDSEGRLYKSEVRLYDESLVDYGPKNTIYHYNENGQVSFIEYDTGETQSYEYENGNMVHVIYSNGSETWHEYDERGNQISTNMSDGYQSYSVYDLKNNIVYISSKSSLYISECFYEYEYDEDGLLVKEFEYRTK